LQIANGQIGKWRKSTNEEISKQEIADCKWQIDRGQNYSQINNSAVWVQAL